MFIDTTSDALLSFADGGGTDRVLGVADAVVDGVLWFMASASPWHDFYGVNGYTPDGNSYYPDEGADGERLVGVVDACVGDVGSSLVVSREIEFTLMYQRSIQQYKAEEIARVFVYDNGAKVLGLAMAPKILVSESQREREREREEGGVDVAFTHSSIST